MTAHACSMLASGGGADTEMNEKLNDKIIICTKERESIDHDVS